MKRTRKIKLTKEIKSDFEQYWDFWGGLHDFARSIAKHGADGGKIFPLPNAMMTAAYSAMAWFAKNAAGNGAGEQT